jgi:hypothetical protein
MKSWNRKKKPKHMTKMKWKSFIEDDYSTDEYIIFNYSLSRCTKRLSLHQTWYNNEIYTRDRYVVFNCNDMKMWKGY